MDLYLKATSYNSLQAFLKEKGHEIETDNYQCEDWILDYIGKIPNVTDEEGNVTEWFTWRRFNVRLINESVTIFDSFEKFTPEVPYRMFS